MFGRNNAVAVVAEFLGTAVLTLLVLSVQRSTIGIPYFVGIAAGLAVAILYFAFYRLSGAQLNPALTFGLWTARRIGTLRGIAYIIVQLLGAWAAYGIYTYLVNNHGSLQPIGGDLSFRVFIAELIGAGIFTFVWAAATARSAVNATEDLTPSVMVGVAFAIGIIIAAAAGIGLINPALALGSRAWPIWGSMGWFNYVAGPAIGAIIGANLYQVLFVAKAKAVKATSKKR